MRVEGFQKQKDFLICVDSDGCALDTMVAKHMRCFGPCLVREWQLEPWKDAVLAQWNEMNLYTIHRGCNRFDALADILRDVNRACTPVPGIDVLTDWVKTTREKSNNALREAIRNHGHTILCKALAWSEAVNEAVSQLTMEDKLPFPMVAEGLTAAHEAADVVVLSGSDRETMLNEWNDWGLMTDVDAAFSQEDGTKHFILTRLLQKGYDPEHVLMVGDDPGDNTAAVRCGVLFYPIRVRWEGQDWRTFAKEALPRLLNGTYRDWGRERARLFRENLQT